MANLVQILSRLCLLPVVKVIHATIGGVLPVKIKSPVKRVSLIFREICRKMTEKDELVQRAKLAEQAER